MSRVNNYPNGFKSPLILSKLNYFVTKLAFGTGEGLFSPFVLLDTGSEETWVQCEGCDPCFALKGKNFNYKASSTYKRMRVDDPMCNPRLAYEGSCGFDLIFMRSRTIGFVGRDDFYFQDAKTGQFVGYKGLAFGCGLKNVGFPFGKMGLNNVIAGIHGLAPGPRSFLTQLDSQIKGRFSYCLTTGSGISDMFFGDDAQISGDDARKVETISMNKVKRFHLHLNGISVDGTRLPIDPSIFELDPLTYSKGFFIDSGSPYTYLARSAFNPLKDAMVKYFNNNYNWHPLPRRTLFDLCYSSYPSNVQKFPSVIFHFSGIRQEGEIDWIMDKDNMFQVIGNNEGFCMTIFKIEDPGPCLFGAYQQVNFKILYDVANGLLSFVPQRCHETTL
ncbi:aspartic proteinase nepenthesin-1-like [Silene latifolia]|uniref:aspartic proteinase nepenthesin-1-like n=1 Tax=Silene latifolia TaxID=37657 RepID=UPI003D784D36